jgi:hypothetical protein
MRAAALDSHFISCQNLFHSVGDSAKAENDKEHLRPENAMIMMIMIPNVAASPVPILMAASMDSRTLNGLRIADNRRERGFKGCSSADMFGP